MPNGKKKKGHKMATHKRKKRLRKNRHMSKYICFFLPTDRQHNFALVCSKKKMRGVC